MISAHEVERRRRELVDRHGEWTAHNIQLAEGVFTRSAEEEPGCPALFPVLEDFAGKRLEEMRIVDLACLEGLYAVEFARRGAQVVGIEGRLQNLEKARFAKEVLGLDNLDLLHDDVRNLSLSQHGSFDLVFCSGILYHLDAPDVFYFIRRMAEVCRGFAFINTHVSPSDLGSNPRQLGERQQYRFDGVDYLARPVPEHDPHSEPAERLKSLWASLDNPTSLWFEIDSLREALVRAGFRHVYHCLTYWNTPDRVTLVATKP